MGFGILFLSTEGLYAEAMRRPRLVEFIQREYKVVLTGHGMRTHLDNYVQSGLAERKAEASKLYADFIGVLRKRG